MKTYLAILCIISITLIVLSYAIGPKTKTLEVSSGKIMAFRPLILLKGTDPVALERFGREQLTPTFKNEVSGVESYILKSQRGYTKGQYVHLLIFDNEIARNFYFLYEHSGEDNISKEDLNVWRTGQIILLDSMLKYTEPRQSVSGYTDYVFIE